MAQTQRFSSEAAQNARLQLDSHFTYNQDATDITKIITDKRNQLESLLFEINPAEQEQVEAAFDESAAELNAAELNDAELNDALFESAKSAAFAKSAAELNAAELNDALFESAKSAALAESAAELNAAFDESDVELNVALAEYAAEYYMQCLNVKVDANQAKAEQEEADHQYALFLNLNSS